MWDDGRNRAVKEALRKNSVQQSVYDSTSRSLDAERRSLESRRVREEGELRAQLRRLQLEQRVHSELDNSGETICTGVTNALMPDSHRPPDKTRRFCPCRVWRCELSRNRQEKSEQLADRSPSSRGV